MKAVVIGSGLLMAAWSAASPAHAQGKAVTLGTVHFPTSCSAPAQEAFDHAMLYQHSFWYSASKEGFEETLKADPNCAIAYWGIALSLLNNPHSPIPAANLAPGLKAIETAQQTGSPSQRERDYIDALAIMYKDYDKLDHRTRITRFRDATQKLAETYPKDDEALLLYGITLNTSASPTDKTYAQQLKGAAIIEEVFKRQPNHPGAPHYLIHLYDYPAIADRGLSAAVSYAKVAADAPHAQHMPSHIFTRVGYWRESIDSNLSSVRAAKATKEPGDQMHGSDYMIYAYLQLARDAEAEATVKEQIATYEANKGVVRINAGAYALAAGPARYAIERGDWSKAAQLQVWDSPLKHTMALTHFARALGAARSGNPDAAQADIAKLAEISAQLKEAKDAYWSEIVDIQRQIAAAWVLHAKGQDDDALKAMSAAADAEDKTEKSPVTPGPLAPARELYGAMLLETGKSAEALRAFETTLLKEPNRLNTYAGAAQAAEKSGDAAKAKAYFAKVLDLAKDAKSDRPIVAQATQYMSR